MVRPKQQMPERYLFEEMCFDANADEVQDFFEASYQKDAVTCYVVASEGGGAYVLLFARAATVGDAVDYFTLRAALQAVFLPFISEEPRKRGRSHQLDKEGRRAIVTEYRKAKAQGVTKAAFARSLVDTTLRLECD